MLKQKQLQLQLRIRIQRIIFSLLMVSFFTKTAFPQSQEGTQEQLVDYQLFKNSKTCGEIYYKIKKNEEKNEEEIEGKKEENKGDGAICANIQEPGKGQVKNLVVGEDHFPFKKEFWGFLKKKKNRVRTTIPDYKTKQGKVYLDLEADQEAKKETINKVIDQYFLKFLEKEIRDLFDKEYKKISQTPIGGEETKEKIKLLENIIFDNNKLKTRETVRKYLFLFPEVIQKIIRSDDPELKNLRPLLCIYEYKHDQERVRKRWSKAMSAVAAIFGIAAFAIPPLAAIPAITLPIAVSLNLASDLYNIKLYVKDIKNNLIGIKVATLALHINKVISSELEKLYKLDLNKDNPDNLKNPDDKKEIVVDIVVDNASSFDGHGEEKIDQATQKKLVEELKKHFAENRDYYRQKNKFLRLKARNLKIRLVAKSGKLLATPLLFAPVVDFGTKIVINTVQGGQMVARYTGKFRYRRPVIPSEK